jgi:hypothetical protein
VAICVHSGSLAGDGALIANRIASGAGSIAVLRPGMAPTTTLWRDEFCKWRPTGRIRYTIAGSELPSVCDDACLGRLVEALLMHQTDGLILDDGSDDAAILEHLARVHIVRFDADGDVRRYRLTPSALSTVQCLSVVDGPHHVFEPRENIPLEGMSNYEMMLELMARGWVWQLLPKLVSRRSSKLSLKPS